MRLRTLLCIIAVCAFSIVNANNGFTLKTVVIDAGHGGKDPGAIGAGKTNEKDVALQVALKLGEAIKKNFPDVNVIYTRKTDVFLELHERAEIANKNKADLFIAVHCNSSTNPAVYGSSTYVLGLHKTEANLEVAKRENAVILLEENRDKNYEFDPNTPEGHIIMSMKQNAFLDQSISFAGKVENFIETAGKRKTLGVKQAGFYVLYKTAMPSILAEIGFISNADEEKFLSSAKGQDVMANSLFRAFSEYKLEMEQSEGEQFLYEQSQSDQVNANNSTTNLLTGAEVKTSTTVETKKDPATGTTKTTTTTTTETKTEPKPATTGTTTGNTGNAKNDTKPATTAKEENGYVTVPGGKQIKRPEEGASGGGKSSGGSNGTTTAKADTKTTEQPVVKTETKTTTSNTGDVKTETKTTTQPTTAKTDNKTTGQPGNTKAETSTPAANSGNPTGAKTTEQPVTAKTENKPVATGASTTTTTTSTTGKEGTITKTTTSTTGADTKPAAGSTTGNVFKVQFCALKGDLKDRDKVQKLLGEISSEVLPNGITRYYAGNAKSFSEGQKVLAKATANGYPGAFIVGFKNGKRMTKEEMDAAQVQP